MNKKSIFNSIKIITFGLLLSAGITYAVNPATSNPGVPFPGGNPDQSVNVGGNQIKSGALGLGLPIVVSGPALFTGDINILGLYVPPPEQGATLCNNGIDDDGNGYIDGADPGCGGPPIEIGFNNKNFNKNYLSSVLDTFSTKKALAATCPSTPCNAGFTCVSGSCVSNNGVCGAASSQPPSTSVPSSNLCGAGTPTAVSGTGPWSWQCVVPPPGSSANCSASYAGPPVITLTASPVTILPNSSAVIGWDVYSVSSATCTASATPSTSEWTTATTFSDQGLGGALNLSTPSTDQTRTYTVSCTNSLGTSSKSVTVNVLTSPASSGNLYVSGKMGIGVTSSTESLEVNGGIKLIYLQFTPGNVCADTSGKLVHC